MQARNQQTKMLMKNKRLHLLTTFCLAIGLNLTAQTVTTNSYIARGATTAFGRCTMSGISVTKLKERGFCWSSETNNPTIKDAHSKKVLNQGGGQLYHIEGLTPATVYHMRAYVLLRDSTVYYGNVVKVITLPKGTMGWSYDNGGSDEEDARINAAVKEAIDYLNEYTCISGFSTSVHYGSGTPTADCSYGGWMRVGPNASYQRTGTILHELLHGIGVGTHWVWQNNATLRGNTTGGTWLGDRVTEFLRFWDNDKTSTLNGDGTHMWPYGINGAHEDTGSELLYMGCSMIAQALGEDGLPPTNESGIGTPAYCFPQEDTIKYYIKSESVDGGLHTAYLKESKAEQVIWAKMSADKATVTDSAAWYITFDPQTRYYQLRNAATGHYLTYYGTGTSGFRMVNQAQASANENFHLMRSRVDADFGNGKESGLRGYWIIHPEAWNGSPQCFTVSTNGLTTTSAYDMSNDAIKQRWLILTADEATKADEISAKATQTLFTNALAQLKQLMQTPHTEDVIGIDQTMSNFITVCEGTDLNGYSAHELSDLTSEINDSCMSFLSKATPSSASQPFDLTYLITDANMENGQGWSTTPTINFGCGEFYQTAFDMNQTIKGLPAGTYEFKAQAFQRPGTSADSYAQYIAGTNSVVAYLYAGAKTTKIQHIASEARTTKLGVGTETAVGSSPTKYIPNNMEATAAYFNQGLYENSVMIELSAKSNLKVGLRNSSSATNYWTIFDNFRLYYYGSMTPDEVTDIEQPVVRPSAKNDLFATPADIYDITGVCVRKQATSTEGLPRGFYIVKGRKLIVK